MRLVGGPSHTCCHALSVSCLLSLVSCNWPDKGPYGAYCMYAMERRVACCRYLDGMQYAAASNHCREAIGWYTSGAPGSCTAPFDRPFNILLNVAVGGLLPGKSPSTATTFPQTMLVRSSGPHVQKCYMSSALSSTYSNLYSTIDSQIWEVGAAAARQEPQCCHCIPADNAATLKGPML